MFRLDGILYALQGTCLLTCLRSVYDDFVFLLQKYALGG